MRAHYAALAAVSLFMLCCAPAQYLGRQQDEFLYLQGARSLLEGRFELLTVPGHPPLYMINPGFPLLLAPLALAAGERWEYYQAFCALLLAAAPWLVWAWLRRRMSAPNALLAAALFGLSPVVLSQSGTVMSEGPYLLATLGLLFALEAKKPWGAAAFLLAATQMRTAALSLLPGAIARPLAQKRWAAALRVALPALAGLALWSLWSRRAAGSVQKLQELGVSYAGRAGRIPEVVFDNARYYLSSWGSGFLPRGLAEGMPALLLGCLLFALCLRGGRRLWKRDSAEPALWMLAGTAGLHAVWPWQYERYLIMPLPFLLWCLAEGLGRAATPALAALLAAQTLCQSTPFLGSRRAWSQPELSGTYEWLRTRTPAPAILASALYVRDGFYAARPALPLPDVSEPAEFFGVLKHWRVRYVLRQEGLDVGLSVRPTATIQSVLDRAGENLRREEYFRLVYENPSEHSLVYELK